MSDGRVRKAWAQQQIHNIQRLTSMAPESRDPYKEQTGANALMAFLAGIGPTVAVSVHKMASRRAISSGGASSRTPASSTYTVHRQATVRNTLEEHN